MRTGIILSAIFILFATQFCCADDPAGNTVADSHEPEHVLILIGLDLACQGKYQDAIQYLDSAVKINPKSAPIYRWRGLIKSYIKEFEQAIEDFSKALEINEQQSDIYFDRAIVYAKMAQNEEAVIDFMRKYKLDPLDTSPLFNTAQVYDRAGQVKRAITFYKYFIKDSPEFDEKFIKIAEQRIRELRHSVRTGDPPPRNKEPALLVVMTEENLAYNVAKFKNSVCLKEDLAVIHYELPEYPPQAKRLGMEATVFIEIYVDENGFVKEASAIKCDKPGYGFEEAAIEAAYKCTYKPAIDINGNPIYSWITHDVEFTLDSTE